jgi:hypothetical protein
VVQPPANSHLPGNKFQMLSDEYSFI